MIVHMRTLIVEVSTNMEVSRFLAFVMNSKFLFYKNLPSSSTDISRETPIIHHHPILHITSMVHGRKTIVDIGEISSVATLEIVIFCGGELV